ncbi:LAFE_0G10066g1_1 [Lachancea fermentati]|uniref:LAFE_0G10066g1_1 n=1 Tax=Lachancea fermentati TaxID=4955 RepID=A0A1G4MHU7_LACFM|nr:LAFE_0G10066g1_1 [Lachancea fermentati]
MITMYKHFTVHSKNIITKLSFKFMGTLKRQIKPFKAPLRSSNPASFISIADKQNVAADNLKSSKQDGQLRKKTLAIDNDLRALHKEIDSLKSALDILAKYDKEKEVLKLIDKWRGVCQAGMSYMFNSTMIKIGKMGGYEELRRREIEAEKRKIEYQCADGIQDEIDGILESDQFKVLSPGEQAEIKDRLNERLVETQKWQEKQLELLEQKLLGSSNREMTMEELSKRLKIDYSMVFPL